MSNKLIFLYAYDADMEKGVGSSCKVKGNWPKACEQIAQSLDKKLSSGDKRSIKKEEFEFHSLKERSIIFIVVCNSGVKLRHAFGLLDAIAEETIAVEKSSSTKKQLTKLLRAFNDPNSDEIARCKDQIGQIKDIMVENLDKIFDNISTMEEIDAKVEQLESETVQFASTARSVKRGVMRRNLIIAAAIFFGILIAIAIVVLVILILAGVLNLSIA